MKHTEPHRWNTLVAVLAFVVVLLTGCSGRSSVGDVAEPVTSESTAEPAEVAPLVGTVWLLDTVFDPAEGPERPMSTVDDGAPAVELVISRTTATVISEPCTDAVYEVRLTEVESGGSLEVIGGGAFQCRGSEGDNANHDIATGGLVSASGYVIEDDHLVLTDENGELVGFAAQDSANG